MTITIKGCSHMTSRFRVREESLLEFLRDEGEMVVSKIPRK